MRIVTQVEELSRSRSRVYLDNEFAFVLYKGELRRYHIREQEGIAEEDYQVIMTEILPRRAKLRAMHLLKTREYTGKQLEDKLKKQYYSGEQIKAAIEYVMQYRYIDDERYARDYITSQMDKRSRRRIEEDLAAKGISRELTASLLQEQDPEELRQAEKNKIIKLLEKKHYQPEAAEYTETMKMMSFLCRKGFDMDLVRSVMKCYSDL